MVSCQSTVSCPGNLNHAVRAAQTAFRNQRIINTGVAFPRTSNRVDRIKFYLAGELNEKERKEKEKKKKKEREKFETLPDRAILRQAALA